MKLHFEISWVVLVSVVAGAVTLVIVHMRGF